MTLSARNWAWDAKRIVSSAGEWRQLLPGEKLTLLCLAEHENAEEGCAWPSQERIAEFTGLGVRSVRRHLTELTKARAIEQHRKRQNGRWSYTIYILGVPSKYRTADPAWMAHQLPDTVAFSSVA